jgi:hypothetical protein
MDDLDAINLIAIPREQNAKVDELAVAASRQLKLMKTFQ